MISLFRFSNYGPFKNEMIFDMRAVKSYKEHAYNLIHFENNDSYLKVAAIHGANASGKSNFVGAYRTFLDLVQKSFSEKTKDGNTSYLNINYQPFLFDEKSKKGNTEFEAKYIIDDSEYTYGFVYNKFRIEYEWLYKKNLINNRKTVIIERSIQEVKLGSSVKRACEKYIQEVDEDVLSLSFFSNLKLRTSVFKDTYECIVKVLPLKLTCDHNIKTMLDLYFSKKFNEIEKKNLLRFLQSIDIGIKDIMVNKNDDKLSVYTFHNGLNGQSYKVPIEIESDGTIKAIALYSFVMIAITYGKALIIDELDMQFHPLLLKYFVDFFNKNETKGQLIFTSHDITLFDNRYMRRDQIWFTEKNEYGEASLYSMAEFKIRNDSSFEKQYLGGVFGGIPNLNSFDMDGGEDGK